MFKNNLFSREYFSKNFKLKRKYFFISAIYKILSFISQKNQVYEMRTSLFHRLFFINMSLLNHSVPHPHLSTLPITGPATSFGDTILQNHHCHCCYHISPWQPCKHRRIKLVRLRWIKRQRMREIQIPLNQQQHTHIPFKTHLMKTLPRSQIYFRHSRAELWDVSGVHPPLLLPTFLHSSPASLSCLHLIVRNLGFI